MSTPKIFFSFFFFICLTASVSQAIPPALPVFSFTVNSPDDDVDFNPGDGVCSTMGQVCTLRAAIMESNAFPGINKVIVPAGTYNLTLAGSDDTCNAGDLDVTERIVIQGAGSEVTIVDASDVSDRIFHVIKVSAKMTGLTLQNGSTDSSYGGGIYHLGDSDKDLSLDLTDMVFTQNQSYWDGGAAYLVDVARVSISASTFRNNASLVPDWGQGGAMAVDSVLTLNIENSDFDSNTAAMFGGAVSIENDAGATVNISGTTFTNNVATERLGGALSLVASSDDGFDVNISESTFSNNTSQNSGGAIYAYQLAEFNLDTVTIDSNIATVGWGGGIYLTGGTSTSIQSSTISRNIASGELADTDDGLGGGIYALSYCECEGSLSLEIQNSTISENYADDQGGGIYIAKMSAEEEYVPFYLMLSHTTISDNEARNGAGGGIFTNYTGTTDEVYGYVKNTILVGNMSATSGEEDCDSGSADSLHSIGYNWLDDATCALATTTTDLNTPFSATDLGSLDENGGPTETQALLSGSPAIDAGTCVAWDGERVFKDQRGFARMGRCDIGAYETAKIRDIEF